MTNAEKFKEVFGFYPDTFEDDEDVCSFMRCGDVACVDCPYFDIPAKWTDEYKGEKE